MCAFPVFPTCTGEAKAPKAPTNGLGLVMLADVCFNDCAHAGLCVFTVSAVRDQDEGSVLTREPARDCGLVPPRVGVAIGWDAGVIGRKGRAIGREEGWELSAGWGYGRPEVWVPGTVIDVCTMDGAPKDEVVGGRGGMLFIRGRG